jgi:uncharacterized small protein (DUF1192 family)
MQLARSEDIDLLKAEVAMLHEEIASLQSALKKKSE